MGKVYLYARNTGVAGTALLETTMKKCDPCNENL